MYQQRTSPSLKEASTIINTSSEVQTRNPIQQLLQMKKFYTNRQKDIVMFLGMSQKYKDTDFKKRFNYEILNRIKKRNCQQRKSIEQQDTLYKSTNTYNESDEYKDDNLDMHQKQENQDMFEVWRKSNESSSIVIQDKIAQKAFNKVRLADK